MVHIEKSEPAMKDPRWGKIFTFLEKIEKEEFDITLPTEGTDELSLLSKKLLFLKKSLSEDVLLFHIFQQINQGKTPEEVFDNIYASFHPIIPYERIGIALLKENNEKIISYWEKSSCCPIKLLRGYESPLKGSSLQKILATKKPRILNDLISYLKEHPTSESTQFIVEEGIKSSLTCPLIALDKPIGFIFFSSIKHSTYQKVHVEIFEKIASLVSILIEKAYLYEESQTLNSLKNQFIGIAAHDLKTPLQVISSYIELLEESTNLDQGQKKSLETIQKQTEKMLGLIKTFLDVSIIESGHLTLNKKKHNLQKFLQEYVESPIRLAKIKNIHIALKSDFTDFSFSFDADRIGQVLNNLLMNSLKFSPPGTTLTLLAKKEDRDVVFSLSDEGPGISEKDLANLFEFFVKGSTKPTGKEISTGLGLAICKKIVDSHGGSFSVKNNPSKGVTFTFRLPLLDFSQEKKT